MNKLESLEQKKEKLKLELDSVRDEIKQIKAEQSSIKKEAELRRRIQNGRLRERRIKTQNKLLMGMLAKHLAEDKGETLKDIAAIFDLKDKTIASKIKHLDRTVEMVKHGHHEDCFDE